MKRFGYLRDPLFLAAAASYALNRWLLKPRISQSFLHTHFNDLLLIPAALPAVLCVQRVLGLRKDDRPPTWLEVALHLLAWSVICEFIGPRWLGHGTADIWDVVAYSAGGLFSCLWWNGFAARNIPGPASTTSARQFGCVPRPEPRSNSDPS